MPIQADYTEVKWQIKKRDRSQLKPETKFLKNNNNIQYFKCIFYYYG